jgi:hypothetical protein
MYYFWCHFFFRSVPEKVAEEEVPSSFDKKAEETLFSSSLSLSPVLAMPSSPVSLLIHFSFLHFDILIYL